MLHSLKVLQRGEIFFSEVANFLENLKISSRPFSEEYKNFPGFVKSISEAEDMLIKEKAEFKVGFKILLFNGLLIKSIPFLIDQIFFFFFFYLLCRLLCLKPSIALGKLRRL